MHPVSQSLYFNKYFMRYDQMHIFDHKGLVSVIGGSILDKLVHEEARLGHTQELRLAAINDQLKLHQDETATRARMPQLRLSDLTNNCWAELQGQLIKAAKKIKINKEIQNKKN